MTCGNEKWFRIAGLLARQRVGQLSEEELRELEEWREVSPENKLLNHFEQALETKHY